MTTKLDSNGDPIQTAIEERLKKQIIKDTAIEFSKKVETMVWEQDITYMEAISTLMEQDAHEPERVAKMLTSDLKAKLQEEAEGLSLVKRTNHRLEI